MSEQPAPTPRWRVPRLTRINRLPRTLGFAATFIAIAWLTLDQGWSHWYLLFAGLYFLVYPQAVYGFDVWRRAKTTIEYRAMMFDSFMLGLWTVLLDFSGLIAFTLLVTVFLNNTMTGGVRQCVRALGFFAAGLGVAVLLFGFTWSPAAPLGIEILIMVALLVYIFSVALSFNTQNVRLLTIKRSVQRTNVVFQSMLTLTELADRSETFEALVESALEELQTLYAGQSFGFVLKYPGVSNDVHFAAFTPDLTETQQSQIRKRLAGIANDFPNRYVVDMGFGQSRCLLYPLSERFRGYRGILIVRGPSALDSDGESLPLLIKQLGIAISNKLLTLELTVAAEQDALTGIYNRGFLDAELALAQARHKDNPSEHFAVLLIDLIGLKKINDQHGHDAGDQIIQAAATALKDTCRDRDQLFRFGGDEFVILCRDNAQSGAEAILQRIRTRVHGRQVTLNSGERTVEAVIHLSVGLATTDQSGPDDVLKLADKRMYEQKQAWYAEQGTPLGEEITAMPER